MRDLPTSGRGIQLNPRDCNSFHAGRYVSSVMERISSARVLLASPKYRRSVMPKDAHNKAAEHHENAAKSHRMAAENHGKGEHEKGREHASQARAHSKTAHEHSDAAHGKSSSQK